jgi:hypothetical protein
VCTVAMLQEEACSVAPVKTPRTGDWSSSSKAPFIPRTALPLPPPPPHQDKATPHVLASSSATDSKLAAVKAYRRTLGLCFKCGMKWSKDHTCSQQVLYVVEVLWESFSNEECPAAPEPTFDPDEQLCLALSKAASCGSPASRTIYFRVLLPEFLLSC